MSAAISQSVSQLAALLPQGAEVLGTSERLPWNGFLVEKYAMYPGERVLSVSRWHVISALGGRPAVFEEVTPNGGVSAFTKPPGALTFIPVGLVPAVKLRSSSELMSCAVEDGVVQSVTMEEREGGSVELLFQSGVRDRAAERIVSLLTMEMESGGPSGRVYAESLVRALVCRYLALASSGGRTSRSATGIMHPRLLKRLREWMEANLHHDVSLTALAAEAKYSSTQLLRTFRASTGLTPHQYLLELRIQRAQDLLRKRGARLIDVASECGFSSQAHLTNAFKARRGMTPGQYQRHCSF
jgi:AraC family transcriptional regulator